MIFSTSTNWNSSRYYGTVRISELNEIPQHADHNKFPAITEENHRLKNGISQIMLSPYDYASAASLAGVTTSNHTTTRL